jgi:hypothetical protein
VFPACCKSQTPGGSRPGEQALATRDRQAFALYVAGTFAGNVMAVFALSRKLGIGRSGNGLWSRLLLTLTLLAFAQQSYLTQTHIHFSDISALRGGETALGTTGHGKLPPADDPSHCPLCQEILLAGAYVAPAAILIPPPAPPVFRVAVPRHTIAFVGAASHDWRGRAPPLH